MLRAAFALTVLSSLGLSSVHAQSGTTRTVRSWITTADRSMLLQEQSQPLSFHAPRLDDRTPTIIVDPRQQFQSIDGFGFAVTGGTAELLMKMSPPAREKLLTELFAPGKADGSSISYIRVTIGASDMNAAVYSYDDLPSGKTDPELKHFSLDHDKADVLPVLQQILAINPALRILASPWSAPAWMKTNNDPRGGSLKPEFYGAYASYLVHYLQEMKQAGVPIDALTIQNEPYNSRNTPSMQWLVAQQRTFLRKNLIPAFRQNQITTKLVLFDQNTDRPDYPLALLADPVVSTFADGTGFHNYRGDLDAMSLVHDARPDKNVYFTEQTVIGQNDAASLNIAASVDRVLIRTIRNWSRNVLLWNLAADPDNGPHTSNGGCSGCQGAVTIDGDTVKRNLAFYTLAHASRFIHPGAKRIASTNRGDRTVVLTQDEEQADLPRLDIIEHSSVLPNVAFQNEDGTLALIVSNITSSEANFSIQFAGEMVTTTLPAGSVATYVW